MNKEFRIGDLFCGYNGNTDIKKEHINGRGYPVVSSGLENTGIIGFSDIEAHVFPSNTITIDMFGNVFFRDFEYKIVTHARVFSLILKDYSLTTETGLYIVSMLSWLSKVFSYNNMCSYKKIAHISISLPVIEHADPNHEYTVDDIDWQYMEDRIKELEEDRIKELEAYLKVTNLDDYELTDEDKKVLSLSRKSARNENGSLETNSENGTLRYKKFIASDLFDIKKGKRLTKANMMVGIINFVGSSSINNGITAKIGNTECIHSANTISVSYNGSVGEVFLQEEPFWASDDVNVWYPKFTFNTRVIEYIMSVIKKCRKKYSYSAKWTLDKMKNEDLELPVTADGNPDFDYMERYIRAIEKLTIADVVKYKDKVISTTKKLVNSQS